MNKNKFYISIVNTRYPVDALHSFEHLNHFFVVHHPITVYGLPVENQFIVSEFTTSARVPSSKFYYSSIEDAVHKTRQHLDDLGSDKIDEAIRALIKQHGIINQLPKEVSNG